MTRWLPRTGKSGWTGCWRDREAEGVEFFVWWGPLFLAIVVARRSA